MDDLFQENNILSNSVYHKIRTSKHPSSIILVLYFVQ